MEVNIVLAYDSVDEVCRLFSEYTDMLINGDPEFREYLEIQNYFTSGKKHEVKTRKAN